MVFSFVWSIAGDSHPKTDMKVTEKIVTLLRNGLTFQKYLVIVSISEISF